MLFTLYHKSVKPFPWLQSLLDLVAAKKMTTAELDRAIYNHCRTGDSFLQ